MTTETFALSRPLKTHNGEITSITLKEPTAAAFVNNGEPFTLVPRLNAAGEQDGIVFKFDNNKAFMGFLSEMTEPRLDDLVLSAMSASDFQRVRIVAANIIMLGVPDRNPTEPSAA